MLNQSSKKTNPLEIAEQVSIIASFAGSIASVISQQTILAALPLSITVALNLFNRQELLQSLNNLSERNQNLVSQITEQNQNLTTELETRINSLEGHNFKKFTDVEKQIQELKNNAEIKAVLINLNEVKEKLEEIQNHRILQVEENNQTMLTELQTLKELTENLQNNLNFSATESDYATSSELYYQRGLQNEQIEEYEIAIQNYTLAIQLDNNHANSYYHRGHLYAQIGNRKAGVDDLRQAAKLFFEQGDIDNYQQAKDESQKLHELSNVTNNYSSQSELLYLDNLLS